MEIATAATGAVLETGNAPIHIQSTVLQNAAGEAEQVPSLNPPLAKSALPRLR